MHPILFEIPGLGIPIKSFGLMVVLGFLLAHHLLVRLGARYGDDPERDLAGYAAAPVWVLVGVMLGARALYVLVEILRDSEVGRSYLENPLRMLYYWQGGLVMYGGLAGGVLAGLWGAKRHGLRLPHALDLGLIAGAVGLAIGRIGCYLVGDDFGRVVPERFAHLPFPITLHVPEDHLARHPESLFGVENLGQTLWATQIWMCVNALVLALVGYAILKRRRYAGQVGLWMGVYYALTRGAIEAFRGDAIRGLWFGGISTSQILSAVLLVGCVTMLFLFRKRRDAPPEPRAAEAGAGAQPR